MKALLKTLSAAMVALILVTVLTGVLAFAPGQALAESAGQGPLSAPPKTRILAFGDSLTEGFGLPKDQGLVPQLRRWLKAQGQSAAVINAGLTGDTSYGGRIRIKWALRHRPDAVIIELGANDFLMGWGLADIEKNLDSVLVQAKSGGRPVLLVGISPPKTLRGVSTQAVAQMWERLAARHDVLLLPDLYAPIWAAPKSEVARYVQADGLHLSAEGVALVIARQLGPATLSLIQAQKEKPAPAQ